MRKWLLVALTNAANVDDSTAMAETLCTAPAKRMALHWTLLHDGSSFDWNDTTALLMVIELLGETSLKKMKLL